MKFLVELPVLAMGIVVASSFIVTPSTSFLIRKRVARKMLPSFNNNYDKLCALVYGWDGDDGEDFYADIENDSGVLGGRCTTFGSAVAESLSHDQDRVGSLARLAVAFSPPGQKLSLKDLTRVEVICVRDDHIEIEAMVCEETGCISIAVPVKFPRECSNYNKEILEGCTIKNLETLDAEAETFLLVLEQENTAAAAYGLDNDELCSLYENINFPSWWIPPECNRELAEQCDDIRHLLNEDEFQKDIIALAQDGLRNTGDGDAYIIKKAKVSALGPAGICLKAAAVSSTHQNPSYTQIMDIMYPFEGAPKEDVESLRAVVLGAIASA